MVACSTKGDPDKDPNSKSFSQSSVKGTVRGSIPGDSTNNISLKRYGSVPGSEPGGGGSTPPRVTK